MYTNRPVKIAIIDDDKQMLEMLKDFFEGKFLKTDVSAYSSGEEALSKIISEPTMIVLDYHLEAHGMKMMDGLQVLKKLKQRFPNTPVVFLSGQEKAEVAANTMKYGAYDYIVKNENAFHRLEIIINNVLGHVELKNNLGTQRFFNIVLGILTAILIIGLIVSRFQ